MKTHQLIEKLQELDPSGEMRIGYEGVAITHPYIEVTIPLSYIDDDIHFHISDKESWININTVSYKDFLTKFNSNIIIDLENKHNEWLIKKEIHQHLEKIKKEEEESIKELTFDIMRKIKNGYKVIQSAETSSMFFSKKDELEVNLSDKECKAVIESLFFKYSGKEWKLSL